MTVAHFQSPVLNLSTAIVDRGENLIKRCIIAIEGTHVCNRGKKYDMPADFIQTLGDNLNTEIGNGREIPLFSNHDKSADSKFGTLDGYVECRPVTAADLPNPNASKMLGKLALFAVAKIFKNLDQVRSGAIKALSPGIDMGRKLIFEVSAVPVASMPGVALFKYSGRVTRPEHEGSFNFDDVRADRSKVAELRDEAIEGVDILIESLRMLERSDGEMTSNITAKQESFSQFVNYLAEVFQIPSVEGGVEYAPNPYARETIKAGFGLVGSPDQQMNEELDEDEKDAVLEATREILEDVVLGNSIAKSKKTTKRSRGGDFRLREVV